MSTPSRSGYSDDPDQDVRMQSSSHRIQRIWTTPRDTMKGSKKLFARKQTPDPTIISATSQQRSSTTRPPSSRISVSTVTVPASSRTGVSSARDNRQSYPTGRTTPNTAPQNESILISSSSDEEVEEIRATRTGTGSETVESTTGVTVKQLPARTLPKRLPKFRFLTRNELGDSVERMLVKMDTCDDAGVDGKGSCLGLFHRYDDTFDMETTTGPSISVPVKTMWFGSEGDVLVSKIRMSMNQVDINKIASNVNCLWYESGNQTALIGLRPCQFVRFSSRGDYTIHEAMHNLVANGKRNPVNTDTLQNDNVVVLFIDDEWSGVEEFYNFMNSNSQKAADFPNMPAFDVVEIGKYERKLRYNFAINDEVERQRAHPNPVIDDPGTPVCQCYVILPPCEDDTGNAVRKGTYSRTITGNSSRVVSFGGKNGHASNNNKLQLIPNPESSLPSRYDHVKKSGAEIIGVEIESMEIYLFKQQEQVIEQQVIEEQLEVEESMEADDHREVGGGGAVEVGGNEEVIDLCADDDDDDIPVRKLCVYPSPPERSEITITTRDWMTLDNGKYINDVIVDFYMIWMARNIYRDQKVLMLSSFFYQRLACWDATAYTDDGKRWRHAQVENWTRNEDIFDKEFIFVPISKNQHWFVVVICNPRLREGRLKLRQPSQDSPGEVAVNGFGLHSWSKDTTLESDYCDLTPEPRQDTYEVIPQLNFVDQSSNVAGKCLFNFTPSRYRYKEPCILLLDSLASLFTKEEKLEVVNHLAGYLEVEWRKKKQATHGKRKFNIRSIAPHIPQQTNSYDCGIYMLHYVEKFLENPLLHYLLPLKSLDSWIDKEEIKKKRKQIQRLVNFLPAYQESSDGEMQ